MLGGPDTKGLGVFAPSAVRSSPQVLEIILGDIAFLGDWIQGVNKGVFKAAFRPQLSVRPFYDLRKIIADAKKFTSLDEIELDKYFVSGLVVFYAHAYLKCHTGEWLQIQFGYFSYMDKTTSGSPKLTMGLYVQLYWKGIIEEGEDGYAERKLKAFPNQQIVQRELRGCLKEALADAKKKAPKKVKPVFEKFNIP
jgi:hypothetical protein